MQPPGNVLTDRQQLILDRVREHNRVEVDALAEELQVTPQTIRRDLNVMCERRILQRTHGGAVLHGGVTNLGYDYRVNLLADVKERIGIAAAALIPDNSSLFINIGTTTEAVARALVGHTGLLIATNNMNVVETLRKNTSISMHIAGGTVRNEDGGIVGDNTAHFMQQFRMSHAIIGVSALDPDGTMFDYDRQEVLVAKAILANARETILVADSTKFERTAPMLIGNVSEISTVITNEPPPEEFTHHCASHGVSVLVVD